MKYNKDNVSVGDYVKLNLCDGLYEVVGTDDYYIDVIDSTGSQTDAMYEDIQGILKKGR